MDNILIDQTITNNKINSGMMYILTKEIKQYPDNAALGGVTLQIIYEVSLRTNTIVPNTSNVVDMLSEDEYQEFRRNHGLLNG